MSAVIPIGLRGGMNTYTYVYNNPLRYIVPDGLRVLLVGHIAADPAGRIANPNAYHLALYLEPDDKCARRGNWPITVGAQPLGGKLASFYNNPGDAIINATFTQVVPTPPGLTDYQFIKMILGASFRYTNNLDYSFPYISPLPFVNDGNMSAGTYNSNSYVSGVLRRAGVIPPVLDTGDGSKSQDITTQSLLEGNNLDQWNEQTSDSYRLVNLGAGWGSPDIFYLC